MTTAAIAFRGKVSRGEYHRYPLTLEERGQGLSVRDVCPTPPVTCEICGAGCWHYWQFILADGREIVVGDECARVATGGEPPSRYLAERRRERETAEAQERGRLEAHKLRNWWRAPEQRELRRMILSGLREERRQGVSDFYRRAYAAARGGRLTPKWRIWIERCGDGQQAADRAAEAGRHLRALNWCRLGRYDRDIVRDMHDRQFPVNGGIWCPPMSEKQVALLRRLAKRYAKQISNLEPWQRY